MNIKRPILMVLSAFAFGEMIAVLSGNIVWVFAFLIMLVVIKTITKKQACYFIVFFIFTLIGFLAMHHSLQQKEQIKRYETQTVLVSGSVYKIEYTDYGKNLYLRDVILRSQKFDGVIVSTDQSVDVKIGQIVLAQGRISLFEPARNFGNFNAKEYYESLGVYAKISRAHFEIINGEYDKFREHITDLRKNITKKIIDYDDHFQGIFSFCNHKGEIFLAMLLGDKSELNYEIKELYSVSGIAHILAISGLHISLIGMCLYQILRKRFGFALSASLSIGIVLYFGLISGMGIVTVRAIVMFGLRLLGEVLGRKYDAFTAVCVSGIMLMLNNPLVIYHSGFQMSFVAILAITVIWPWMEQYFYIKHRLVKVIIFVLQIHIMMAPIIAWHYYQLPTYSFLLNLVVVPMMGIVVVSGVCGIIGSYFSLILGKVLMIPGCGVLEFYEFLCKIVNKLPFANVIVGKPKILTIILYYGLFATVLAVLYRKDKRRKQRLEGQGHHIGVFGIDVVEEHRRERREKQNMFRLKIITTILFFGIYAILYLRLPDGFYVTFLDVGQGDGIFIHTYHGDRIMIDGGSSSVNCVGKYRIIPYLKAKGIDCIDYAMVTHTDMDHISGIMELLQQSGHSGIQIKNLVLPDIPIRDEPYHTLEKTAQEMGVSVCYITQGSTLQFGSVHLECVAPMRNEEAEDKNDLSAVFSLKYKHFSMLFTGDISSKVEERLTLPLKNYTVLKVAHHGSGYSSSALFLKNVNPMYSIVSVGERNRYGHPAPVTIGRLQQQKSQIVRTDQSGGITVFTNGENFHIESYVKNDIIKTGANEQRAE